MIRLCSQHIRYVLMVVLFVWVAFACDMSEYSMSEGAQVNIGASNLLLYYYFYCELYFA